jgi:hypothetical protein
VTRYILRYRGAGSHSESDLARVLARRRAKVIDHTPRMVLVEGAPDALHAAFDDDPDWLLTPERSIERPDPKPRVRRKAK